MSPLLRSTLEAQRNELKWVTLLVGIWGPVQSCLMRQIWLIRVLPITPWKESSNSKGRHDLVLSKVSPFRPLLNLGCFPGSGKGAGPKIMRLRKSQSETWDNFMNPFDTEHKAVVSTYSIHSQAIKGIKGRSDRNEGLNDHFCYQCGKQNCYSIRNYVHRCQRKYHATIAKTGAFYFVLFPRLSSYCPSQK